MKKCVVGILAAMASICCLTGCGASEKPQEQTTTVVQTTTTAAETTTAKTEKETTTATEPDTTAEVISTGTTAEVPADGIYSILVESDSSMFKITKAELTVANGELTAVITLGGTGYIQLYMGTAEEAAAAEEAAYISYVEDADGAYTFTIPVEELDKPVVCAAYSKKKEQWYDRQLTFLSASLSDGAAETETVTSALETETTAVQAEGTYSIELTFGGGSGKSTVLSPATITVSGDKMVARIEWSSPNYDYMLVNGEKYLPVNTEGNSVFEIPVSGLDTELTVTGDTVAMSKPREIEYTLTFHSATMKAVQQ